MSLDSEGYGLAIYYIAGYVAMNLACFLVISNVSQTGENLSIDDFNGLYKRQPVMAFVLAVGLFGLAGIPPFVGFMGKFMILTSALRADHLLVVCLAAINTAIAIYYYLSVVKAAYTGEPEERPMVSVHPIVQATGRGPGDGHLPHGSAPCQVRRLCRDGGPDAAIRNDAQKKGTPDWRPLF